VRGQTILILISLLCSTVSLGGEITSVDPNQATQGSSLPVTIYGSGTSFGTGGGTAVRFQQGSSTIVHASSIDIVSNEEISAQFSFSPTVSTGYYDVRVEVIGVETCVLTDGFKVLGVSSVLCGDVNESGMVDIDDVVYIIAFIFAGGPEPSPYESGDVNCSWFIDIDDVVYMISYIFAGGTYPCDPYDLGAAECTITGADEISQEILPKGNLLSQNFPNPFNSATTIEFTLNRHSEISIEILNILGQRVRTLIKGYRQAGTGSVTWNAKDEFGGDVASGIYFYRMISDDHVETKRMLYLK